MTWTLVQSNTSSGGGTPSNPITVAFTSAQTAGNLVTVHVRLFSSTSNSGAAVITDVTDTKGNGPGGKYKLPTGGAVNFFGWPLSIFTLYAWNIAAASASANTVDVAWGNGSGAGVNAWSVVICEWSNTGGAITVDPFDFCNANTQSNNTAAPSVEVYASSIGDLIIATAHGTSGQTAVGTIGGATGTLITNFGASGTAAQYGTNTTVGLTNVVWPTTDTYWDTQVVAFTFGGRATGAPLLPQIVQFASDHVSSGSSSSVTFLGSLSGNTSANVAGNTAGNLIVLAINQQSALAATNPIVDTNGNHYFYAGNTPGLTNALYYAYNCAAGANTVTVTWVGSATDYFCAVEVQNISSGSNPLDGYSFGQSTPGTALADTGNTTVRAPFEFVIAFFNTGASAQTQSGVWSAFDSPDNGLEVVQWCIRPSLGAINATCTFPGGASHFWEANIASFLGSGQICIGRSPRMTSVG